MNATTLEVNHLEIAARTWANEKAREVAGIAVDNALNKTDATIPNLDLIGEAEEYMARWLAGWLKNNLVEFMRTYMHDAEERAARLEK